MSTILSMVRKAGPEIHDVHVDTPLTNISVAYVQSDTEFIAGRVFPVVPVMKQSDKYYKFNKETFFRNRAQLWVPGTLMPQSGFGVDNTPTYSCNFRAFEYPLRWDIRANADAVLIMDRSATEFVTRVLLLNREVEWAGKYFTTGVWGTDVVGGVGFTKWDDYTNSNPLTDFRTARLAVKKNTGFTPNTAVISQQVFETLADHPLIKEIYKYTQASVLTPELVARALRVENLFIAGAVQITSVEGAASEVYDWIYGKRALLCYVNPRPSLLMPSAGYIFSWTGMTRGFETAIERIPDQRTKADYIQGITCYDLQTIGTDLGYFFDACIT